MKNETGKANHTPGPWEMRGPCEITGRYSVTHNGPLFYVGDAGEPGDGEANARLAASAPELLEALKVMVSHWPHYAANMNMTQIDRDAIGLARAAIAKATGSNT